MNRVIKFRAWHKVRKEWLFGYDMPNLGGFSLIGEVVLLGALNEISLDDWHNVEIMQYSGIKDKNGKEIYEGDIIESKLSDGRLVQLGEVCFGDCFDLLGDEGFYGWFLRTIKSDFDGAAKGCQLNSSVETVCIVAGDIYTSPELLQP